jgi:flavin reductase (DIM6/NTAB) family NADH-FMN oxidoreductase RutF
MEPIFEKITPENISENAIKLIGYDWMLITAGSVKHFNTMTAAWGGLGFLWKKPVAYIFIRPTRLTYEFIEANDFFTICFFEERYRKILNYCGAVSGREIDKTIKTGLKPAITELGNVYFNQARLVFECKKIYHHDINPGNFMDKSIDNNYPLKDYHCMYIGEIVNCFIKKTEVLKN